MLTLKGYSLYLLIISKAMAAPSCESILNAVEEYLNNGATKSSYSSKNVANTIFKSTDLNDKKNVDESIDQLEKIFTDPGYRYTNANDSLLLKKNELIDARLKLEEKEHMWDTLNSQIKFLTSRQSHSPKDLRKYEGKKLAELKAQLDNVYQSAEYKKWRTEDSAIHTKSTDAQKFEAELKVRNSAGPLAKPLDEAEKASIQGLIKKVDQGDYHSDLDSMLAYYKMLKQKLEWKGPNNTYQGMLEKDAKLAYEYMDKIKALAAKLKVKTSKEYELAKNQKRDIDKASYVNGEGNNVVSAKSKPPLMKEAVESDLSLAAPGFRDSRFDELYTFRPVLKDSKAFDEVYQLIKEVVPKNEQSGLALELKYANLATTLDSIGLEKFAGDKVVEGAKEFYERIQEFKHLKGSGELPKSLRDLEAVLEVHVKNVKSAAEVRFREAVDKMD